MTHNSAFVFIKPHANLPSVQQLVKETLTQAGVKILEEGEITAQKIDEGMLIDQHYYAIASKATLLKPADMPVPADKFKEQFGVSWEEALSKGQVYNAIDACKHLGIDSKALDAAWGAAKDANKLVKFGGGFYCGLVSVEGKEPIYVFNGFFMSMRSKFVEPGTSIYYYSVEFDPAVLSWGDFRAKVLGPTDPATAPADSLRGKVYNNWEQLGLAYKPNVGDNSVHGSASTFEGLAERANWLKKDIESDPFGAKLLAAGIPLQTIKEWSVDPQVKGKSLFDTLEDTDADECISIATGLIH